MFLCNSLFFRKSVYVSHRGLGLQLCSEATDHLEYKLVHFVFDIR